MFHDDYSTATIGLSYGGEERPLEGELSDAHRARVDAEEAEMKAEQERLNQIYREEVARMVKTLPAAWRGWVRVDTRRDVDDLFRVVQRGGFNK